MFAWQLMFRCYVGPLHPRARNRVDSSRRRNGDGNAAFYAANRLLKRFAACSYDIMVQTGDMSEPRRVYLTISALALDLETGACTARSGNACGIYERRPLSCRSVPIHYSCSAPEAEIRFDAFVSTPDYACDTSSGAPSFLSDGEILCNAVLNARQAACAQAAADAKWKRAIVKAMKSGGHELPTLADVERNASIGVLVAPMASGWLIAREAGLLEPDSLTSVLSAQIRLLDRLGEASPLSAAKANEIRDLRRACAMSLANEQRSSDHARDNTASSVLHTRARTAF